MADYWLTVAVILGSVCVAYYAGYLHGVAEGRRKK